MPKTTLAGAILALLLINLLMSASNSRVGGVGEEPYMRSSPPPSEPHATELGKTDGGAGTDALFVKSEGESPVRGPYMENLCIKYSNGSAALYEALKNGEVDLTDASLDQPQMEDAFADPNIETAISQKPCIRQLFFNNNATTPVYPNVTSPTAFKSFRQGLACLVDKTHMVNDLCNFSYRIDTPIARPQGDWWVDWSVSQYDSYGNLLGNYPYEYNPTLADYYLNLSGFVQGATLNPYYDSNFTSSARYLRLHPETNATMEPLIFIIRNDPSQFLESGRYLEDILRKMGIPINATEVTNAVMITKMRKGEYHISIGGWSLAGPPPAMGQDFLSVYASDLIGMANYMQFRNSTYDEYARITSNPPNLTSAKDAALKCQRILIEEAASVWLWTESQVMGYRNIYGIANSRLETIDNRWTFLAAHAQNPSQTELRYGLYSPPASLNVIIDYANTAANCLDRIYDTLLSFNPYDRTPDMGRIAMPWMAEDWDVGEWESPYEPEKGLTKLTFLLRDGLKWQDGVELNSTDVKFTIDYLKGLGSDASSWLFYLVSDVHHVTTPDARSVVVYENVTSIWALNSIGSLPILPKHIFQNITDITGYTPGANEGHPASETLIGSGPWKYVDHSSSVLFLEANRDYFMETPPIGEVDFRYDWEMGCYVVDNMDEAMAGEAFGTSGTGIHSARWEPGCDVNGDGAVDLADLLTIAYRFNLTWGLSAKRYVQPPPSDCAIYVEPSANQVLVGENITVYVKLRNLTKLSGIQFKLSYDPTKLSCLDLNVTQILQPPTMEAKRNVDNIRGLIWYGITLVDPTQPISGNITLVTIKFNATGPGSSALRLWNTMLAMYGAIGSPCQLMPHASIGRNVVVGVTTPSGNNITVAPSENVNVTFTQIASPGVTTLNITPSPLNPFASVECVDIKTTASYTGNITVQRAYDPAGLSLEEERSMKIWLWNETAGNWIDITASVDTENNIVYGVTSHLSIFGVTSSLGTFGDTSIFGVTTVRVPPSPPPPPQGLVLLNCYEITTSNYPQGLFEIKLSYDDSNVGLGEEEFVQMWLWNEIDSNWTDITAFVETTANDVYGFTPHLSIFGVTCLAPLQNEVAVIDSTCSKAVVGQGYDVTVNFTIANQGGPSDFDVLIYRNATIQATVHVSSLYVNTQTSLTFTWNTANWPKAKYGLSVHGEKIVWIAVTTPGDVNVDHYVGIDDIFEIASHFGQEPPNWNPIYDIIGDNYVGVDDIFLAARNFGEEG